MKKLTVISILLICILAFGGCGHKHDWYVGLEGGEEHCNEYDCGVNGCEETSIEEHEYGEWEHIDASCEGQERKVRKCKNCGNEEEQIISEALGHKYGKWKVVTKATCDEGEIKKRECSICGNVEEKVGESLGHKPGDWEIIKNATITKKGNREKRCKKCGEVIKSEKYSLSKSEKKQYLYDHCQTYSYDTIARYPDKYKGKYAKFTGEVVQVVDKHTYRVDITKTEYDFYEDTIYVTLDDNVDLGYNILEDDIVTIYGILDGEYSYETVLGSSMTIPSVIAYQIQRN